MSVFAPIFVDMKLQHWYNLALFLAILSVIFLLIFKQGPKPVFKIAPVKTIEHRIEGKETEINRYFTKVGNEKKIIATISLQIDSLRTMLREVKQKRDTFMIVRIQDTIINTLTQENSRLRIIVNTQDSIIVAQRYIINAKDTIIKIGNQKLRKVKNQRNWSIVGNVVLTGIAIGAAVK